MGAQLWVFDTRTPDDAGTIVPADVLHVGDVLEHLTDLDAQLSEILKSHDDPQKAAEAIVAAAQEGGSKDNITCITLYVV